MEDYLPDLVVNPKTGKEKFEFEQENLSYTALDFWKWFASDLVGNVVRGALAEFIVGMALGLEMDKRLEWNDCDLCTPEGVRVEVKSSAYCQSWRQKELSKINFRVPATEGWNAVTGEYSSEKKRRSDVYVFCILKHKDKLTVDPMCLDQWDFYVVPTSEIDSKLRAKKTVGLETLQKLNHRRVAYDDIKTAVNWAGSF